MPVPTDSIYNAAQSLNAVFGAILGKNIPELVRFAANTHQEFRSLQEKILTTERLDAASGSVELWDFFLKQGVENAGIILRNTALPDKSKIDWTEIGVAVAAIFSVRMHIAGALA